MKSYIVYSSSQDVTTIWGVVTDKRCLADVKNDAYQKTIKAQKDLGFLSDNITQEIQDRFWNDIKTLELDPNKATSGIDIFNN